MGKMVLVFVVLTALLILGILIMMKPDIIVLQSQTYDISNGNQPGAGGMAIKEIIILGSTLIMVSLVGLSVLGFRIFKELKVEGTSEE